MPLLPQTQTFTFLLLLLITFVLMSCQPSSAPQATMVPSTYEYQRTRNRSFGTGIITTAIGTMDDVVRDAVFMTDGRIVVAGRTQNGFGNNFAIARYNPDGSLDSTFDGDGVAIIQLDAAYAWAHGVDVDSNGRVVAAGRTYSGTDYNFAVIRLTTNGSLDASFNGTGYRSVNFNNRADFARAVDVRDDDVIVVGGYAHNGSNYDFAAARILTNGNFDASFSSDGLVTTAIGTDDDVAQAVLSTPADQVVLVGYSVNGPNQNMAIVVHNADGSMRTQFDTDGINTLAAGSGNSKAFAVQRKVSNGKFGVLGSSHNGSNFDFHVVRWDDADGGMEMETAHTIGTGADAGYASKLEDIDSRYIAAGKTWNGSNWDFGVIRYINGSGALDASWAGSGSLSLDISGQDNEPFAVAYSDGKIIVAGRSHNGSNYDFALVRFQSTGSIATAASLDTNYNATGSVESDFSAQVDEGNGMTTDSSGNVIVGGWRESSAGGDTNRDFAVARYTSAGALDATFGTAGLIAADLGTSNHDEGEAVVVQSNGSVIVGGWGENGGTGNVTRDWGLVRFTASGVLDTSFSTDGTGIMLTDFDGDRDQLYDLAVQSDDKIIAVGWRENGNGNTRNFAVVKYLTNGQHDPAYTVADTDFNGAGDQAYAVTLQSDEKIVVGGFSEDAGGTTANRMSALARYNTDGTIDTTFSGDGKFEVDMIGTDQERILALTVQSDGKIIAGGWRENGASATRAFTLMRLNTDGTLDATFGTNGLRIDEPASGVQNEVNCLYVTLNQKIVAVGRAGNDTGLARYHTNGLLDTTFSSDGMHVINVGGTDYGLDCERLSDGRFAIGGRANSNFYSAKLWP